ncbi:hypothetical protein Tco_0609243 [Tanacetum coccineum]
MRSPKVRRQRKRVVGFEESPNREGGRIERNVESGGPSKLGARENKSPGMNLPQLCQKAGSILNYEDLKAKFQSHFSQQKKFTKTHLAVHNIKQREGESTRAFATRYTDDTLQILDLPSTYKGLMEKTYTWIKARDVATNGTSNDRRESFERSKKTSWDNNRGQRSRDRISPYRGPNHGFLSNLSKMSGIETPNRRGSEIETTGQLGKRNKKKKEKMSDTRLGEWKKGEKGVSPIKAPVLLISHKGRSLKKRPVEEDHSNVGEIKFPPLLKTSSAYPVIIKLISLEGKSLQVDSEIPLVGFSGKHSWPLGEVPLEIIIGEEMRNIPNPLSSTKKTEAENDTYNVSMALLAMGDRHRRTIANSTGRYKIPRRGN